MPVFDFECKECGNKFDLMISNKDKEKAKCPQCGSAEIKQLLSRFATLSGGSSADSCAGCPSVGTGG